MDDLEPFFPDRMASRILGLGDIQSLIEKAQSAMDFGKNENICPTCDKIIPYFCCDYISHTLLSTYFCLL